MALYRFFDTGSLLRVGSSLARSSDCCCDSHACTFSGGTIRDIINISSIELTIGGTIVNSTCGDTSDCSPNPAVPCCDFWRGLTQAFDPALFNSFCNQVLAYSDEPGPCACGASGTGQINLRYDITGGIPIFAADISSVSCSPPIAPLLASTTWSYSSGTFPQIGTSGVYDPRGTWNLTYLGYLSLKYGGGTTANQVCDFAAATVTLVVT